MAKQIEWTPQALEDYRAVLDYLENAWNERIADAFAMVTEEKLSILAEQPYIGLRSEKQLNVRSILLTKHNRLYYQVNGGKLIVLNIFDTRQDPTKNEF